MKNRREDALPWAEDGQRGPDIKRFLKKQQIQWTLNRPCLWEQVGSSSD